MLESPNDPCDSIFNYLKEIHEQFLATAYVNSPYHNPIIGWMNDLENLNIEDLKKFDLELYDQIGKGNSNLRSYINSEIGILLDKVGESNADLERLSDSTFNLTTGSVLDMRRLNRHSANSTESPSV